MVVLDEETKNRRLLSVLICWMDGGQAGRWAVPRDGFSSKEINFNAFLKVLPYCLGKNVLLGTKADIILLGGWEDFIIVGN